MNMSIDLSIEDFMQLEGLTKSIKKKNSSNIDLQYESTLLSLLTKKLGVQFFRKSNKISFRVAGIAILEEEVLETKNSKRDFHNYDYIHSKAKKRFKALSTRNKKRFPTLEVIHPEDSFIKFEDSNPLMRSYYNAISKVLIGHIWILDNDEAHDSLKEIYTEIKNTYLF